MTYARIRATLAALDLMVANAEHSSTEADDCDDDKNDCEKIRAYEQEVLAEAIKESQALGRNLRSRLWESKNQKD